MSEQRFINFQRAAANQAAWYRQELIRRAHERAAREMERAYVPVTPRKRLRVSGRVGLMILAVALALVLRFGVMEIGTQEPLSSVPSTTPYYLPLPNTLNSQYTAIHRLSRADLTPRLRTTDSLGE